MLSQRRNADYEPVGIVADNVTRHRSVNGVSILGGLADIDRVLAILRVQGMSPARIVITRPHHELGRAAVQYVMKRAYAARIPVEQLPDLMSFRVEPGSSMASMGSASGMNDLTELLGDPVPTSLYPGLKRLIDFSFSAVILTCLAPLMALVAIAVAFGIQRPVLFFQIRPGRQRRPFRLLKFRTMRDPLDERGRPLGDAERTPWVGRLLRRTRLDELPQFWNVLKGDMAIIGPRPLIAADLATMPDKGQLRCRVSPGITGWAQVNGGHLLAPAEKHALDLWYCENASLALDLHIVVMTVLMMLRGEARNDDAIAAAGAAFAPEPAE
jgi:lipopolysaccharide/colanic/teichoic acid biosynthesis glycosyltransferase